MNKFGSDGARETLDLCDLVIWRACASSESDTRGPMLYVYALAVHWVFFYKWFCLISHLRFFLFQVLFGWSQGNMILRTSFNECPSCLRMQLRRKEICSGNVLTLWQTGVSSHGNTRNWFNLYNQYDAGCECFALKILRYCGQGAIQKLGVICGQASTLGSVQLYVHYYIFS